RLMRMRWLALLLLLVTWPSWALAEERILDYHSRIQVAATGEIAVSETIRVVAEGQQIRRGIYRDFPTDYEDPMGNHYRVDFNVISVQRNGQDEPWHTKKMSNGVRLYIGDPDRMLPQG